MAASVRRANRSTRTLLRLYQSDAALAERWEREAAEANTRLLETQRALDRLHQTLEQQVEERTADLTREMARRRRYADALVRLTSTDALTGLSNRSSFVTQLGTMLLDAADTETELAILFLNIDNFKQVNDVRGHSAGDRLLQAASRLLSEKVGADGRLARWGSDEFVLALPAAGRARGLDVADALREALLEPLSVGEDAICLDAAIGVAVYPQDGQTQEALLRAADMAMFEAKSGGKGRVREFDPDLARDLARRHVMEQGLRGAAERGEFSLAFQPIFESGSLRCHAAEALLRWHSPELGAISPAVAIQLAEQTGQIAAIGRWVLLTACRAAAAWADPALAVTVNVSVGHVLAGTLLDDVAAALAETGLPPARLQLEITESMFVSDSLHLVPLFEALRRNGHRILLDDFGTGFSSLGYLGKLPLDVIKIDQSFVRAADQDSYAIIRAILSIARALSLGVTAEGVETEGQRETLTAMGADSLQGYLLGRPMPAPAFAEWVRTCQPLARDRLLEVEAG